MFYSNIKPMAIEDGIGCRVVLFVSGCRHACKGCFQPETWNFKAGKEFTQDTENQILDYMKPEYIDGLTLLGGEPFEPENQKDLLPFVERLTTQLPQKTIWAYTGCTFEELTNNDSPYHTEDTIPLLNFIDILVDGPFILKKKSMMLPFRGSENQRVLDCQASLEEGKAILSAYNVRQHF